MGPTRINSTRTFLKAAGKWKMGLITFYLLVDRAARPQGEVSYLQMPDTAIIGAFRQEVFTRLQSSLPPGLRESDLKVFKNKTAEKCLSLSTKLAGYGEDEEDPLVVQVPKIWFQLMDAHTHEPFEGTAPASVPLT
ncbi:hypothetical protein PF010_g32479, partial [Phytophthora fragariae]